MSEFSKEQIMEDLRRSAGARAAKRSSRRPAAEKDGGLPADAAPTVEATSLIGSEPSGAGEPSATPAPVSVPGQAGNLGNGSPIEGEAGPLPVDTTKSKRRKRGPKLGETEEEHDARLIDEAAKSLKMRRLRKKKKERARLNAEFAEECLQLKAHRTKHNAKSPYRRFEDLASIGDRAWAKGIALEELYATIDLMKKVT